MIKKTVKLCLLVSILSLQASSHLFAMDDGEKDEIKRLQIKKEKYTSKISNYSKQLSDVEDKLNKLNIKSKSASEDLSEYFPEIQQHIPSITQNPIPINKDPDTLEDKYSLPLPEVKKPPVVTPISSQGDDINFQSLIKKLEKKYSKEEICTMAGYIPPNFNQNYNNMLNGSPGVQMKRLNIIRNSLKEKKIDIKEFLD